MSYADELLHQATVGTVLPGIGGGKNPDPGGVSIDAGVYAALSNSNVQFQKATNKGRLPLKFASRNCLYSLKGLFKSATATDCAGTVAVVVRLAFLLRKYSPPADSS